MSGYSYGAGAHEQALALITALSNPAAAAASIQASKDAQAAAEKAMADLQAARNDADQKLSDAEAARDAASKTLAVVSDHKAEIVRRQDSWEANLNARETDLKRREDEHAAWWAHAQDEASAKTAALVNRAVELDERAKSLKDVQAAVDAMKAEFQAKLAKIKAINE